MKVSFGDLNKGLNSSPHPSLCRLGVFLWLRGQGTHSLHLLYAAFGVGWGTESTMPLHQSTGVLFPAVG